MTSTEVVKPTLHHVTLKTTRLQEMIDWYSLVVGLEVTHLSEGNGAWLSNDDANHRMALLVAWEEDPHKLQHAGLHHSAYEYPSMDGLLDTYVRLKEHGILPHACLDHGMTMSLYYADPDGNSLELQYDQFGDWASSKQWMSTAPEFADNPIGVPVDPDRFVAEWQAGATMAQLHARAYAREFEPDSELDLHLPTVPTA